MSTDDEPISRRERRREKQGQHDELPGNWKNVQTAIWLIGIAILAWQGWWWPGILVLVAISGIFQAYAQSTINRQEAQQTAARIEAEQFVQQAEQKSQLERERAAWLPPVCPSCGGPLSVESVHWTGENSAACPFCSSNLKPV